MSEVTVCDLKGGIEMLKMIRRIFLLPFLLLTTVLWGIGRIAYEISGMIAGFIILGLGLVMVYHIVMQSWHNVIFLGLTELCLIALLFGAAVIVCLMEEARNQILKCMEGAV